MAETLTLTVPQSVTNYKVVALKIDYTRKSIVVVIEDTQGDQLKKVWTGTVATTLINQLNTANLTTNSLQKRILDRLVADGLIAAGTVTGSPD